MTTEAELAEAEKYFKWYDCTHFYMFHDDPKRYDWYKGLGIPTEVEQKWAQEVLDKATPTFKAMKPSGDIWKSHSRIIRVAFTLEPDQALDIVLDFTLSIVDNLSTSKAKIIVAENLFGTSVSQEDGMIARAKKIGLVDKAQQFVDIAKELLCDAVELGQELKRADCAFQSLKKISTRLGLVCEVPPTTCDIIVYVVAPNHEKKLLDPTPEQLKSLIPSMEWKKDASLTLQRLPYSKNEIERVEIAWQSGDKESEDSLSLEVCWSQYSKESSPERAAANAKFGFDGPCQYLNWATVYSLKDATEILDAALCNDEERLRGAADWS